MRAKAPLLVLFLIFSFTLVNLRISTGKASATQELVNESAVTGSTSENALQFDEDAGARSAPPSDEEADANEDDLEHG